MTTLILACFRFVEKCSMNILRNSSLCVLKVRPHQTRMTRMIYMLSQCKDAKDNPAALFARMRRHEWRELSVFSLKNLNFGGYSRRVNQSGACSSSDIITSGGRKSETTMEDKVIVIVCGYSELYIHLRTFTKTGIHFATRLELPGRSPSHDANSRLLCSEFHAWMKQVNSKCSCVQLRTNSAIYSRLVWTHLKKDIKLNRIGWGWVHYSI